MNNPDDIAIDVEEQRAWLKQHKASTALSWSELGRASGIAAGTLSNFGGDTYKGDNVRVAKDIYRWRQHLATQAELRVEAPAIPGYVPTPTSKQILSLLAWAHRGRMTAIAMGPGTGKTIACDHYQDSIPNVWKITGSSATATMTNMLKQVVAALGLREMTYDAYRASFRIRERLRFTPGLLIVDEAQHYHLRAIEEIRSWYDDTGVGVAFVGNLDVISRFEGGNRAAAFAQIFSRIGMRMERALPLPDDARAIAAAWQIEDDRMIAFIIQKAMMPGGLRTVSFMLELATMMATAEAADLTLKHMSEAWAQLATRALAA